MRAIITSVFCTAILGLLPIRPAAAAQLNCAISGQMAGRSTYYWFYGVNGWEGTARIECFGKQNHLPILVSIQYQSSAIGGGVSASSTIQLTGQVTVDSESELFGHFRSLSIASEQPTQNGRNAFLINFDPNVYSTLNFESEGADNAARRIDLANGYFRVERLSKSK